MSLDPRGSAWSRWDLHVHTPDSIVHNYPGDTISCWDMFVDDLETLPPEFKVLGINDYLFLDGYQRLRQEKSQGRLSNIELILPVVELRLNVFGGTESQLSRVNFHVIFSDELEPQVIREQFLSALSRKFSLVPSAASSIGAQETWSGVVTRTSLEDLGRAIIDSVPPDERRNYHGPLQEGFNNLTLPLEAVREALSGSSFLAGYYVTAVGKTEWADIKWRDGSIADKKDVINSVECIFTAAESVGSFQRAQKRLEEEGVNHRLLDCSDSHNPSTAKEKDRVGNCYTWVKADPTFGGLLQAIEEYEHRVFVGDKPPQLRRVREHPSKYIDRVKVYKRVNSSLVDEWFSVDLPLNPGLVAIIGNKGSGKSALAEVVGLLGGSRREDDFSFLTEAKFRDPRQPLADHFIGDLCWRNDDRTTKALSESVELGSETRVQHLPQRYLESLCNEIPSGGKTQFDAELERIIYAHLPTEERLGASSLEELIEVITGSVDAELRELRSRLHEANEEIAELEARLVPEAIQEVMSHYHALRQEWVDLKTSPPAEVPEPDRSDPDRRHTRDRLRDLATAHEHIGSLIEQAEHSLADVRRDQAALAEFDTRLRNLQTEHEKLRETYESLLSRLEVADDVSTFTVDESQIEDARRTLAVIESRLVSLLDGIDGVSLGLRGSLAKTEEEQEALRAELSAPEEAREAYLKRRAEWESEVVKLRGEVGTNDTGTLLGARAAYSELDSLPSLLDVLRLKRNEIARSIHSRLKDKATKCASLYKPLQEYVGSQELPSEYQLAVGTSLVDTGFADALLEEHLNRHVAGSFCGKAESEHRLGRLIDATDFDDVEKTLQFLTSVDAHLRLDLRQDPPTPTVPSEQIRKSKAIVDVYALIFGQSFLSPRYNLLFGGKPIYRLSPGEKGTLLLVFFLLAEVDTRPLIIDQPEDNLDNNTVYRVLVKCFQKAKNRRQVIIVTHNPNLAVVCDADQVVVAAIDRSGPVSVSYTTGAIERVSTIRALVDILEGTEPAFKNRSIKYTMHLLGRE